MNSTTKRVHEVMVTIERLVASGVARIDETSTTREVIGIAADGVEVQLGMLFAPTDILRLGKYLAAYPAPSDW